MELKGCVSGGNAFRHSRHRNAFGPEIALLHRHGGNGGPNIALLHLPAGSIGPKIALLHAFPAERLVQNCNIWESVACRRCKSAFFGPSKLAQRCTSAIIGPRKAEVAEGRRRQRRFHQFRYSARVRKPGCFVNAHPNRFKNAASCGKLGSLTAVF